MKRKRFKKLLMSQGVQRNTAEGIINVIVSGHRSTKAIPRFGSVTPEMKEHARQKTEEIRQILALHAVMENFERRNGCEGICTADDGNSGTAVHSSTDAAYKAAGAGGREQNPAASGS